MKYTLLLFVFALLLQACGTKETNQNDLSQQDIALAYIDSLNAVVSQKVNVEKTSPDAKLAMYCIQAYNTYAIDFPEDKRCGEMLFKAAQMYEHALKDNRKAIEKYKIVYDKYPEYKHHPMALFHIGSLYHDLGDKDKAIEMFKLFIEKYPDHPFAEDAEGMINIVEMGIDEFLKQAQEQA